MSFEAKRRSTSFTVVLVLASIAGSACSGGRSGAETGVARVVVQSSVAGVARLTVNVSAGDGLPGFEPIVVDLARSGERWSGRIEAIPAGKGRRFEAVAYDALGAALHAGATKSDIEPGAAAVVLIQLTGPAVPGLDNAFPVIDGLSFSRDRVAPGASVELGVTAHDPDPGDTLAYVWRASCGTFDDWSRAAPRWTAPGSQGTCLLSVTVTDDRSAAVTASISLTVTSSLGGAGVEVTINQRPVILGISGSITLRQALLEGDLDLDVLDPDGDPLTYAWTSDCPGIFFDFRPPYSQTRPHLQVPGPSAPCVVRVAVSDAPDFGGTIATLVLPPNGASSSACQGVTCQTGQICDPADGACKPNPDRCAGVTCTASDLCHELGACDPATGVCSNPSKTCPAGQACDAVDGQCKTADLCAGVTCTASDLCHELGACDPATGVCSSPLKTCPAGQRCDGADGLCKTTDLCAGVTCTPIDLCHEAGACDAITGACSTPVKNCAAGESCDLADGLCKGSSSVTTVPRLKIARSLALNRIDGITVNGAGTGSFVAATSVFNPAKDIDGISVEGAGGADLFLSRYDPGTGAQVWAKAYGDDLSQFGKDLAAPTADGTLAAIGTFAQASRLGSCIATPQPPPLLPVTTCSGVVVTNPAAFQTDFLLLADAATGAMKAGTRAINNAISGQLNAVAANPNLDLIAVCGYASGVSQIAPAGTAFAGGTRDLVIGVFNTAGVLQWSRQVGGPGGIGDEECSSIAVAGDGTVFAVGKYNANLDLGTGALPTLPNVTNVRHMWLAHFSATGATLASASFGTLSPTPAGNVSPLDLELDAAGNLVVGGNFTASFPVGALVSAGGTDAFVAKFTPALAPVWGVRLGNTGSDTVNSVGFGPAGDVIAVGSYSGNITGTATTGAAALTAPGTASNAFILKLGAATGATHFGAGHGDASIQQATDVAVHGDRIQLGGVTTGLLDFGAPTAPMDSGLTQVTFTAFATLEP